MAIIYIPKHAEKIYLKFLPTGEKVKARVVHYHDDEKLLEVNLLQGYRLSKVAMCGSGFKSGSWFSINIFDDQWEIIDRPFKLLRLKLKKIFNPEKIHKSFHSDEK